MATTLFTGMVVELVADVQDGRRDASPGQLLRAVTPVLGQLILVGIVAGIGIVVGFILIIVPGLFLITIWSVAAPVVVLEHPGAFAALRRSREMVSGNGWQVFGVILVLYIVVAVVSFILEAAAESAGSGAGIVVRVIVGVLTAPLAALAASVLYFELGGRRSRAPRRATPRVSARLWVRRDTRVLAAPCPRSTYPSCCARACWRGFRSCSPARPRARMRMCRRGRRPRGVR